MDITTREDSGATVVELGGALDTGTAPDAGKKLDELIEGGATKVVVDMTHVDYVSSAGLRVLLASAKRLRKAGGNLAVCGLNETVQEVFDMSGFSSILKVFANAGEALQGM